MNVRALDVDATARSCRPWTSATPPSIWTPAVPGRPPGDVRHGPAELQ